MSSLPSSPISPNFPSLTALLSKKSKLNSERHFATTSNDSNRVSSAPPLQDLASDESRVSSVIQISTAPKAAATINADTDGVPKPKVARNRRATKNCEDDVDGAVKKRKPRTKTTEALEKVETKGKSTSRRRSKADTIGIQTKLPRGRITKLSIKADSDKTTQKTEIEDSSPNHVTAIPTSLDVPDGPLGNGLLLQEAVKRRTYWTPPKKTKPLLQFDSEEASTDMGNDIDNEQLKSGLLAKFGYGSGDRNGDKNRDIAQVVETIGLRKRKLIELVSTNVSSQRKTAKSKAPTKKLTITELAIAAYADNTRKSAALTTLDSAGGVKDSKMSTKTRSRPAMKNSKSTKAISEDSILLSPESALRQVSNQDFIFGTSSQLAKENSPTLLSNPQQSIDKSIRESNQDESFEMLSENANCLTPSKEIIGGNSSNRLWSAAASGPEKEAIEVDVVDLADSPETVMPLKAKPSISVVRLPDTSHHPLSAMDDEWLEVDDDSSQSETSKVTQLVSQVVESRQPASCLHVEPNSKSNKESTSGLKFKSQTRPSKGGKNVSEKPDFDSYTTAQLAKEIESYRFKPVKSREQMITLLEKCWEGKQRMALGDVGLNAALLKPPVKAIKEKSNTVAAGPSERSNRRLQKDSTAVGPSDRPIGRPRKASDSSIHLSKTQENSTSVKDTEYLDTSASRSAIPLALRSTPKNQRKYKDPLPEEIEDSDSPLTPSPLRRATPCQRTPQLTLRRSPSPSPAADSAADDEAALHTHIMRAITTAPRASPPALVPSWHEKILLYDPIVLEDLTAWLNTGALDRVGWDGEVSAEQVKRWCTAKGVCCLWRETLRGKARQRL